MKNIKEYAEIILNDERGKIASETPTIYEDNYIERLYKFLDGAVVRYEWQGTPDGRTSPEGKFNHRFTLITLPNPNPNSFELGVIKQIDYPKN